MAIPAILGLNQNREGKKATSLFSYYHDEENDEEYDDDDEPRIRKRAGQHLWRKDIALESGDLDPFDEDLFEDEFDLGEYYADDLQSPWTGSLLATGTCGLCRF